MAPQCSLRAHVGCWGGGGDWPSLATARLLGLPRGVPMAAGTTSLGLVCRMGMGHRVTAAPPGPRRNVSHKGLDTEGPVQEQGPSVGVG